MNSWIRVYKYSHISLILEILPDFAGLEVPDFDETIHASCDQELTIWREGWALHVGLLTKLCGCIKEEGKCKKLDRKNCRYHDLNQSKAIKAMATDAPLIGFNAPPKNQYGLGYFGALSGSSYLCCNIRMCPNSLALKSMKSKAWDTKLKWWSKSVCLLKCLLVDYHVVAVIMA